MRAQVGLLISLLIILTHAGPLVSLTNDHLVARMVLAQTSTPADRFLPGFVFDPVNERVMMFGGGTNEEIFGDTWVFEYETETWTEMTLATVPTPRGSIVMVYDSTDEVIILFGGYDGTGGINDTWVFDCNTEIWTEVTPALSPPSRGSHAMVYDSVNDKVILFSGYGADGPTVDDTWAYDYSTNIWEKMNPTESPHARYGAGHVYDEVNESMIIIGGNSGGYFSDTWSYDYATDTWTELNPTTHPPALKWSGMTYDSINHKTILFGGDHTLYQEVNETWIYDSTTNEWEEREPTIAPPSRESFGFAYDSINEKAILFGGTLHYPGEMNDTWAYDYNTNTWEEMRDITEDLTPPIDPLVLVIALPVIAVVVGGAVVMLKRR